MRSRSSTPGIERIFDAHLQRQPRIAPLKIALIAHLKYPIAQPYSGGLEMHTHLIARKLSARGHHVVMFAARGSDRALDTVEICDPTAELRGAQEQEAEAKAYTQIVRQIAAGGFDVVHNNSLHPVPLAHAAELPPMMSVLHTPPFSPLAEQVRRSATVRFVAVSDSVARQWRDYVRVDDIVPNGIELDTFVCTRQPARSKAIWYGRIVPEKGLHLAIDAARHAGLELDFAGPILDHDYWAQSIAPRCGGALNYLGHLDHATLRRHIAQAGVALITPRWEEPFGLVAAEALSCGTPVAAFRRGALPDVVGDAGVLADPDDVQDLARAALAALQIEPTLCRRRAEERLDCNVMITRYEAIYEALQPDIPAIAAAAD